ncbi:MAG: hypothetical protein COA84_14005 [Robiginitomaculum sp.]|nr:MAG: hypothetical protein COA84_14005 [Robiginitomaculum sp.]
MNEFEPRLYLIGRSDIPQMNAGKLAAQCAHAANEFEYNDIVIPCELVNAVDAIVRKWRDDRAFGTTITLIGTDVEIRALTANKCMSGYVHDPSYPMYNAMSERFTAPMDTVGWIFPVNELEFRHIRESGLELYP